MNAPGLVKNHYETKHGKPVTGYKCPYGCRKDNMGPSSMNRHVARKHIEYTQETSCWDPNCNETFTLADALKAHFAKEHEQWLGTTSVIEVVTNKVQLSDFNNKHKDAY